MTSWTWLIDQYNQADLYRELVPSAWYLDAVCVWEDMQRFKLFGELT